MVKKICIIDPVHTSLLIQKPDMPLQTDAVEKICLQFLRLDPAYTYVAQGLVIIVAVALDLRKYLAKK